jgi:cell division protease FtsH
LENKKIVRNIIAFLGLPILVIIIVALINGVLPKKAYNYSEVVDKFRKHEVIEYSMNLGSGDMEIKLSSGEIIFYSAPSVNLIYNDIKEYVNEYNKENPNFPMTYNLIKAAEISWITNILTFILMPVLLLGVFSWFFMRRMSIMGDGGRQFGFGKAKVKNLSDEKRKTSFDDVAGADEEKEELSEIVEFLKHPKKYNDLGARIPKGVLLIGPPGTGKTLIARAVAGEAGVPFFSISGSDFVEMFVGVGASRVRSLFEQAKKNSPCIIFIDEIDAVGRQRGAGLGGGHDEREQTLNQLLVEMDGFGVNEGVIMIAATNRPDILDPALMRPGRFDRHVVVNYPDMKGREEILRVHAKGKPFAPDVKLRTIAKTTSGFTGADLENLINEAALLSAKKDLKQITMKEIEDSTIKVVMGTEKKSRVITPDEKEITAYHESGHAIATYFCKTQDKVHEISIIPRGMAGGYTMSLPEKDKVYVSKNKMLEHVVTLLGGRVAEAIIFDDISTGASNDIERATGTVKSMVTKYGMSDKLGPISYGENHNEIFIGRDMGHVKNYSEKVASEIDEEIRRIVNECYVKVEKILQSNIDKLHQVAKTLIEKEKINGSEFETIMQESGCVPN